MARLAISPGAVLCALLASAGSVHAEEAEELDPDFLEFLGGLDSDDEAWAGFLAAAAGIEGEPVEAVSDEAKRKKVKDDDGP